MVSGRSRKAASEAWRGAIAGNRQPHPELVRGGERPDGHVALAEQQRFVDLQLELRWRHAGAGEVALEPVGQIAPDELTARQERHRDVQRGQAAGTPARSLTAGGSEQPVGQRLGERARIRDGADPLVTDAAGRLVRPAHHGREPEVGRAQGHLGLEQQHEFVGADRPLQRHRQRGVARRQRPLPIGRRTVAMPARELGRFQRRLGQGEQAPGVGGVLGIQGRPCARGHAHGLAGDRDRARDRRQELERHRARMLGAGQLLGDQGEAIGGEPSRGVGFA